MQEYCIDVSVPASMGSDDIDNGVREAIARAGYQVGDVTKVEEVDREGDKKYLSVTVEIDDTLADMIDKDVCPDIEWQDVYIQAN